jgi:hypothetical protein
MFYSTEAEALRSFIKEKLQFFGTDVGDGWLIFDAPEADLGVHPTDGESPPSGTRDVSFYCDDIQGTVRELKQRGVEFTGEIEDHGYGLVTFFKVPGAFDVQLYEPRYSKGGGLAAAAEQLREMEEALLRTDVRRSPRLVDLLADDFIEFGRSGRIYTRPDLAETLQAETPTTQTTSRFRVQMLHATVALLTYCIERHGEPPLFTLRSSVWHYRDGRWQMVFHQATETSAPPRE